MDCTCQLCLWAKGHGLNVESLGGCPKVAAVKFEQENRLNTSTMNTAGTRPGNVANIIGRLSQINPKPDVTVRKNQHDKKRIFQARFSYDAAESDELTFPEGAKIEGIEKGEEGWMKGKLLSSGKVGMFPLNFVEEVDDDDSRNKSNDSPDDENKTIIQNRPMNKRISSSGTAPTTELYANIPINDKIKERAKVLYEYKAEQPDEISLPAGTFVNILRRQVQDEGWLEVEYLGKIGLFPENFIKLMPPTEEKQPIVNQPPTPPPVKPKPSTPSGSTTPSIVESTPNPPLPKPAPAHPPAPTTEVSSTTTTSTKIRDLQNKMFVGRQLPMPGDKLPRPKTIIGPSEPVEKSEPESSLNNPQEKIAHHPTRDRPMQPGKRPPSMYPSANVNTASDETVNQTTSFPVKESTPPVTVIKPALLPKTDHEVKPGIKTQEVTIVPAKKPSNSNSTTSIHSNPSSIVENHSDSPFVTRKEFDALLSLVKQLQKQVEELSNK